LVLLAGAMIVACIIIAIIWPPRCSTTPEARIAHSILLAGCDRC